MESIAAQDERWQRGSAHMKRVLGATPHVRGLLVMTRQGEVQGAVGGQAEQMTTLASFAVGAVELLARLGEEAGCGELESVMTRCGQGHMVIHHVGEEYLMCAFTDAEAPLGLLAHDLSWCAARLAEIYR